MTTASASKRIIDLSNDLNPKQHVTLSDKLLGDMLREKYYLDALSAREEVEVVIPCFVFCITSTFFEAMFGPLILYMGPDKFHQRYRFSCESGKDLTGSLPGEVWNRHHPKLDLQPPDKEGA